MELTHTKYTFRFIWLSLLLIVVILTAALVVDPFGILPLWRGTTLYKVKPSTDNYGRLHKFFQVSHLDMEILIVGNSRVDRGIPTEGLASQTTGDVYNAAFPAATPQEILEVVKLAARLNPKLRRIIWGVDPMMYNHLRSPRDMSDLPLSGFLPLNAAEVYLSIDSLGEVKRTLVAWAKGERRSYYGEGGRFMFYDEPSATDVKEVSNHFLKIYGFQTDMYKDFKVSAEAMRATAEIVKICHDRGIQLDVFINPDHVVLKEIIWNVGVWNEWEEWKRAMVAAVGSVVDFSVYSDASEEAVGSQMTHYYEVVHYTPVFGQRILDSLRSQDTPISMYLTPNNIEAKLTILKARRQTWASAHAELVTDVRKFLTAEKESLF